MDCAICGEKIEWSQAMVILAPYDPETAEEVDQDKTWPPGDLAHKACWFDDVPVPMEEVHAEE